MRPHPRDTGQEGIKVGRDIWEEEVFADEDKVGERGMAKGERSQPEAASRGRVGRGSPWASRRAEISSAMARRWWELRSETPAWLGCSLLSLLCH